MKRAVGYVRISKINHARNGASLPSQRTAIERWAVENGYELLTLEQDEGISGSRTDSREALQRAIELACQEGAALVVYSLSRLSRSLRDMLSIAETLERSGADLVSITESQIDTTTPSGKLIFRIFCVLAQFEREILSSRTSAALQHKKSQGLVYGPTPFGYRRERDKQHPDPEEQRILQMIRRWRERGWSLGKVAASLNHRGILAKKGGKWSASSVRSVLASADRRT